MHEPLRMRQSESIRLRAARSPAGLQANSYILHNIWNLSNPMYDPFSAGKQDNGNHYLGVHLS